MLDEIKTFFEGGGRVIEGDMLDRYRNWHRAQFNVEPAKCDRIVLSPGPDSGINFHWVPFPECEHVAALQN